MSERRMREIKKRETNALGMPKQMEWREASARVDFKESGFWNEIPDEIKFLHN